MERINATSTFRRELINAVSNPSGSVPRNHTYAGKLFRSQLAVKLLKNLLPMSLGSPNYRICIMVDNDRNVFLPLPLTSLVNTNVERLSSRLARSGSMTSNVR